MKKCERRPLLNWIVALINILIAEQECYIYIYDGIVKLTYLMTIMANLWRFKTFLFLLQHFRIFTATYTHNNTHNILVDNILYDFPMQHNAWIIYLTLSQGGNRRRKISYKSSETRKLNRIPWTFPVLW